MNEQGKRKIRNNCTKYIRVCSITIYQQHLLPLIPFISLIFCHKTVILPLHSKPRPAIPITKAHSSSRGFAARRPPVVCHAVKGPEPSPSGLISPSAACSPIQWPPRYLFGVRLSRTYWRLPSHAAIKEARVKGRSPHHLPSNCLQSITRRLDLVYIFCFPSLSTD